ncbi:MAG TPA: adenosylmethionine--8-amino-7-oxononanoate transaminase [Gammaproteobacteria bacterium]|nr:adenosylmethionine--8-amino-7-oxononanoate transaminase [Gammaproteobacteria bacterium]
MKHPTSLMARDQKSLWHPFTQHGLESEFLPVVSAKGAWLQLADGKKILDAISSWWTNLHGHAQPDIASAIYAQALQLEHTLLAGFTHEPAVRLAEILLTATQASGANLTRCFYSDNGATAVEVAMKMAYQYYKNQQVKTRNRFIAITHAYHGDTLGSMALSARDSYHQHFSSLLPEVTFIDPQQLDQLENLLTQQPEQYCALIIEPMIQGAGGMKFHSAEFLAAVAALCHKAGVLLIVDEVFTGFYRTGKCFAFEHADIKPDLLCLAKGLTGGFLPLAATLTTEAIFNAYYSKDINQAFLHGHTFTANPIACAAAIASWQLLQQPATQENILQISKITQRCIQHLSQHENASLARSLGTVGAINKKNLPGYMSGSGQAIRAFAMEKNVLLRPLGSALYAVPPYCITADELEQVYQVIELILNKEQF